MSHCSGMCYTSQVRPSRFLLGDQVREGQSSGVHRRPHRPTIGTSSSSIQHIDALVPSSLLSSVGTFRPVVLKAWSLDQQQH